MPETEQIKKPLLCKLGWHRWRRGMGMLYESYYVKICEKCGKSEPISDMEIALGAWG